ncbi:MAG: YcxB family protein [Sphingobacteriales bacterium]|jgi:hypothetical protein
MKLQVSYQKSQVLQALRYHFISRREIKLMMILVNVFALISAVLFYFKLINPLPFLMSSVLWIAMMGAFWLWLPWSIYRKSKTFRDSFVVDLDENHFSIETATGSKLWAWREFSDMIETPGFFHLYFDTRSFFLIPKDVFTDDDAIHLARGWMKEKIKKNK